MINSGENKNTAENFQLASAVKENSEAKDNDESLLLEAMQHAKDGHSQLAEKLYREFLSKNNTNDKAWYRLGLFLKDEKRSQEAIDAVYKAISIKPDDIYYRNLLVIMLWRDGQMDEAVKQGYLSLALKDRIAVEGFLKSNYAQISLNNIHPYFQQANKKKNIVSFSLWGTDPVYVTGALINAQLIPEMYDSWTARFYCDDTVPKGAIEALKKMDAEVFLIEDKNLKKLRSMWRFFVMDDPNVEYFLCRDTDSRVNVKEVMAVQEWVASDKKFHIMRDHILHNELILAGMWGGVAGVLPNIQNILLESNKYNNNNLFDQVFLMEIIWPLIKNDVLVHDSVYAFPDGKDFLKTSNLHPSRHVGGGVKTIPEWQMSIYGKFISNFE